MPVQDFITRVDDSEVVEFRIRRMESGRIALIFPNSDDLELFDELSMVYDRLDDLSRGGWNGRTVVVDDPLSDIFDPNPSSTIACGRIDGQFWFKN